MKYVIITERNCNWGERAKDIIDDVGGEYVEILADDGIRAFLLAQDINTLPQVFLNGTRIGGYDDLFKHLAWIVEQQTGPHSY